MIRFFPGMEQEQLGEALTTLVERSDAVGQPDASPALWQALGDVGVLGLCTEAMGGQPVDLVAAMETLGAALCPGPLVGTVAASQLCSGGALEALVAGRQRATLTDGRYIPWGASSDLVIEMAGGTAWRVAPMEPWQDQVTLSGEPWSVGGCRRVAPLGDAAAAMALVNVALSAYLLGAARHLVERGAEHARGRVQFGRPIGDFQAVAHPLAVALAETSATRDLAYLVAAELVAGEPVAGGRALARTWQLRAAASRASVAAAMIVHQVMGAMGFATEIGIGLASTRIRQWSLLPPAGPENLNRQGPDDPEPREP